MKASELQAKSSAELDKLRIDLQEKVRSLRFKISTGQVKNVREIRAAKKDLARVRTILTRKSTNEQSK